MIHRPGYLENLKNLVYLSAQNAVHPVGLNHQKIYLIMKLLKPQCSKRVEIQRISIKSVSYMCTFTLVRMGCCPVKDREGIHL